MYSEDLLEKIAQENATAEERIQAVKKPEDDRFKEKVDALLGRGVPFNLLGYTVELKFTMKSFAFLETHDIHKAGDYDKVMLFAVASTLHDDKVNWRELIRNGYTPDEAFQKACMEAWELSHPLAATCPPDKISQRITSGKPKPSGFGLDYTSMLVTLGKNFGWTEAQFWTMSPRAIGFILDEYNWDVHYQNLIEKAHMKSGGKK